MMLAWYHWHGYELQAWIAGIVLGTVFGTQLGVLFERRRRRRKP